VEKETKTTDGQMWDIMHEWNNDGITFGSEILKF
jgi:hypothetical protein